MHNSYWKNPIIPTLVYTVRYFSHVTWQYDTPIINWHHAMLKFILHAMIYAV